MSLEGIDVAALSQMQNASSLHEDQASDIVANDSEGEASVASNLSSSVHKAASHFGNRRNICALTIDDTKLEKNILSILDRLTALEVFFN